MNKQRQASLFSGGIAGEKRDNSSGLDLTRISCCGRAVGERVLRKTGACLARLRILESRETFKDWAAQQRNTCFITNAPSHLLGGVEIFIFFVVIVSPRHFSFTSRLTVNSWVFYYSF